MRFKALLKALTCAFFIARLEILLNKIGQESNYRRKAND
jgi:hypothetical protein